MNERIGVDSATVELTDELDIRDWLRGEDKEFETVENEVEVVETTKTEDRLVVTDASTGVVLEIRTVSDEVN